MTVTPSTQEGIAVENVATAVHGALWCTAPQEITPRTSTSAATQTPDRPDGDGCLHWIDNGRTEIIERETEHAEEQIVLLSKK